MLTAWPWSPLPSFSSLTFLPSPTCLRTHSHSQPHDWLQPSSHVPLTTFHHLPIKHSLPTHHLQLIINIHPPLANDSLPINHLSVHWPSPTTYAPITIQLPIIHHTTFVYSSSHLSSTIYLITTYGRSTSHHLPITRILSSTHRHLTTAHPSSVNSHTIIHLPIIHPHLSIT